jgi:iron complex transport system ATP-binding protein
LATDWRAKGGTVVMSLHDLRVAHCFDLVVVMNRGRVAAVGTPEAVLTAELLREVFGVTMRMGDGLILELP